MAHQCPACKLCFSSMSALSRHFLHAHDNESDSSGGSHGVQGAVPSTDATEGSGTDHHTADSSVNGRATAPAATMPSIVEMEDLRCPTLRKLGTHAEDFILKFGMGPEGKSPAQLAAMTKQELSQQFAWMPPDFFLHKPCQYRDKLSNDTREAMVARANNRHELVFLTKVHHAKELLTARMGVHVDDEIATAYVNHVDNWKASAAEAIRELVRAELLRQLAPLQEKVGDITNIKTLKRMCESNKDLELKVLVLFESSVYPGRRSGGSARLKLQEKVLGASRMRLLPSGSKTISCIQKWVGRVVDTCKGDIRDRKNKETPRVTTVGDTFAVKRTPAPAAKPAASVSRCLPKSANQHPPLYNKDYDEVADGASDDSTAGLHVVKDPVSSNRCRHIFYTYHG